MGKTLVVNGSPRLDKANTGGVLGPFIEGLTEAGAEVEVLYPSRLKLKPCSCGQMHCWYVRPGECSIKDDMDALYPKLRKADTLVLATPVYIPLPGAMQDFINRLCPLVEPRLEFIDGRTRARFRPDVGLRTLALVATGGWWELGNFDTVTRIAEELASTTNLVFAGALLRPHAFVLWESEEPRPEGAAVLEAVRLAGRELATDGVMSPSTLAEVSRPLIAEEELRRRFNEVIEERRSAG